MSFKNKSNSMGFLDGLAGGLVSGIAGIFGQSSQNNTQKQIAKEQLKAQAEENQKTREYNKQLAEWQNEESIKQWNRENAYNTPSAQMQRYMAAGLNPDLIYGQSNMSAASPVMTAGEPATPQDMSPMERFAPEKTLLKKGSESISDLLDFQLKQASVDKVKNEGEKAKQEATGQSIENKYKDAVNTKKIESMEANINLDLSSADLNKKEIEHLAKDMEYLDDKRRDIDSQIKTRAESLTIQQQQQALRESEFEWKKIFDSKYLATLAEKNSIERYQAEQLASFFQGQLKNAKTYNDILDAANKVQSEYYKKLGFEVDERTGYIKITKQLIERYGSTEKIMQLIHQGAEIRDDILKPINDNIDRAVQVLGGDIVPKPGVAPIAGFGRR